MDIRRISILGSTGSIGMQALDVVEQLGLEVEAISANKNIKLLEEQARKYRPHVVSVMDENAANELKKSLRDCDIEIKSGMDGLCETASLKNTDLVLNSVVGIIGLRPTLEAIRAKKNVALANKETLVAGGAIVKNEARMNGVKIIPVDSEHSAIFQCLRCGDRSRGELKKIILTASGGPFFGYNLKQLANVTPEQALQHPNWRMGSKITVDCATMMNKGLELIEAVWLFDCVPEKIEIVVHRESVIHSMVEFTDNCVIAQLGAPDMRLPIQYAITYPDRYKSRVDEIDFLKLGQLSFFKPDEDTFKCLKICKKAINAGGLLPAAANAANEKAVELFLNKKISFTDIGELVEEAVNRQKNVSMPLTVENILKTDEDVKKMVSEISGNINA